jgi:hypothetical protein
LIDSSRFFFLKGNSEIYYFWILDFIFFGGEFDWGLITMEQRIVYSCRRRYVYTMPDGPLPLLPLGLAPLIIAIAMRGVI